MLIWHAVNCPALWPDYHQFVSHNPRSWSIQFTGSYLSPILVHFFVACFYLSVFLSLIGRIAQNPPRSFQVIRSVALSCVDYTKLSRLRMFNLFKIQPNGQWDRALTNLMVLFVTLKRCFNSLAVHEIILIFILHEQLSTGQQLLCAKIWAMHLRMKPFQLSHLYSYSTKWGQMTIWSPRRNRFTHRSVYARTESTESPFLASLKQ